MNIAIIGSRGYPCIFGGYETLVSELAPRLAERGNSVTVYCHRNVFKSRPEIVNGVYLKYFPSIPTKNLSQITNSFLATLHVIFTSADIVFYVNSANGPFGLLTKIFRKKTAINVDGLEWMRPKWEGFGAKYFYFASKTATKLMDVVVTDSEKMDEVYRKEFDTRTITIAYGANYSPGGVSEMIEKNGLAPNSYYLVVGRLVPDNNASIIIQEFLYSSSSRKLVIVGDVPYKDDYADSLKQIRDPRIIFTGYINNDNLLDELYTNAFAYIHGHAFGGTNPSLLKALASGCCILAFDNVFNREVLQDEEYGLYFTRELQSLARLIDFIESNPATTELYRNKARDRIEGNYTWDKVIDYYEVLFKSLYEG
ncbi:MAG: DUF1972 domain-containing protein [Bacteroidetes bacterium]|nr:DUF1972 domain-containing protein [Bacteroidota bacterium]